MGVKRASYISRQNVKILEKESYIPEEGILIYIFFLIFEKDEDDIRMNDRELAKYLKLIKEMRETVKMVHGIDKSEEKCTASITATIKTGPSKTFPEY